MLHLYFDVEVVENCACALRNLSYRTQEIKDGAEFDQEDEKEKSKENVASSELANHCSFKPITRGYAVMIKTRPDTRLPQSRADGQGLYLRSLDHLGRSSEAKDRRKQKK